MEKLILTLKELKEKHGIIGIKQSFEDEGVLQRDVLIMRRMCEASNVELTIKIGGCEAKTDIDFCKENNVNGIVAPMVESEFALKKFIKSANVGTKQNYYFNVETKTAIGNINNILGSIESGILFGVVIGRSDLVASFDLNKSEVNSTVINEKVYDALKIIKTFDLKTIIGGNLTKNSSIFIQKMYNQKLLDRIETRNVVIELNDNNIDNIDNVIDKALLFELNWQKYNLEKINNLASLHANRIDVLEKRLIN